MKYFSTVIAYCQQFTNNQVLGRMPAEKGEEKDVGDGDGDGEAEGNDRTVVVVEEINNKNNQANDSEDEEIKPSGPIIPPEPTTLSEPITSSEPITNINIPGLFYEEGLITNTLVFSHILPSFSQYMCEPDANSFLNPDSAFHLSDCLSLKLELNFPNKSNSIAMSISSSGRGSAITLLRVSHWHKGMCTLLGDLVSHALRDWMISAQMTGGQIQVCTIAANERLSLIGAEQTSIVSRQSNFFSAPPPPPPSVVWGDSATTFRFEIAGTAPSSTICRDSSTTTFHFSMEIAGTTPSLVNWLGLHDLAAVFPFLTGNGTGFCVETDRFSFPVMHQMYAFSGTSDVTRWISAIFQIHHVIPYCSPLDWCHAILSRRPPHHVIPTPYLLGPSESGAHQVIPVRCPLEVCHVIPCQYLLNPCEREAGACHVITRCCCPQYAMGEAMYVFLTPLPTSLLLISTSRPPPQDAHGQLPHPHGKLPPPLQEEHCDLDNSMHVFSSFSPVDHVDAMWPLSTLPLVSALSTRNMVGNRSFMMVVSGVATPTESRLEEMVVGTQCQDRVGVGVEAALLALGLPSFEAPSLLQILSMPSYRLEGIESRLGVEQRRVSMQETSADTAEVCVGKATKVSADGNKAFSAVSILKVRNWEEDVEAPGDSSHCLPNPLPDTMLVKPPAAVDESFAEMGVAAVLENGLGMSGCVVEPVVTHDIEVLPPQEFVETANEEGQDFDCCLDFPYLLYRPFREQGGEQDGGQGDLPPP